MAPARKHDRRAVAYSGSECEVSTVLDTSDAARRQRTVDNSNAAQSADAVVTLLSRAAHDSFGQSGPDFPIFEAFSKLDMSNSLDHRTQVAVRIYCTDDRRSGFRVMAFSPNKDYRYGSKVGYKKVSLEGFLLKDHPITDNLIKLCSDLGLEVLFFDSKDSSMIRAIGQVEDDPYGCRTLIEYCHAKDRKPQFRTTHR